MTVLVVYCLLIVGASVLGGWIPLAVRLDHRRLELLVSFVSGVMLGVALLHLLPHALAQPAANAGAGDAGHDAVGSVVAWVLGGFLAMFFVERFFCFHHHDVPQPEHAARTTGRHHHRLTWAGAAIGLTVHGLAAGVALAASVVADAPPAAGLGTFLAIVLHKPFDALTLGTLMAVGRGSTRARHAVNAAFGLVVPAGAAAFLLGAGGAAGDSPLVGAALAFSAGTFLCISLSDLLPELQFHRHDRVKLSAALLLGIAVAWGASRIEAGLHEELSSLDATGSMGILIRP